MPTIEWSVVGTRQIGNGTVLSIPNVDKSQATLYTCRAINNAGYSAASARLIVFGKFLTQYFSNFTSFGMHSDIVQYSSNC